MARAKNPLRYGLKFSQQVHPIDVHTDVWRIGDDAGFDHIWPFDHLIALGPDPGAPGSFCAPHGLAVDANGDLYVAEVVWTIAGKAGLVAPDCHTVQKLALAT